MFHDPEYFKKVITKINFLEYSKVILAQLNGFKAPGEEKDTVDPWPTMKAQMESELRDIEK